MSFKGVNVNKLQGQLNNASINTDSVFILAFAIATASLPSGMALNTAYPVYQVKDAEDLGIDAAFDANESLLAYNALKEFCRNAPDSMVYFMPVATDQSPLEILQLAAFKTTIRNLPDVKGIAIGGTIETVSELADMAESIQAEIAAFATEKRLIDFVVLQGNGEAIPVAVSAYENLRALNAPNVSISIAQDPAVASIDAAYAKYADVGAVLGMLAVRKISENVGSVDIVNKPRSRKGTENYTLTGLTEWLGANLSDGKTFASLSQTDQVTLTSKGYLYAGSFEGYDGVYFNSSPTCVDIGSDFAYIENNRVWNKAARLVRKSLLPHVRSKVKKDPTTGYIRSTSIAAFEGTVNKALGTMESDDDISGYGCFIDPKQILSESSPLLVKAQVVKDDIVHEFDVDLGLVNSL